MVTSFLLRIHDQRERNCTGGWRYDQHHWDNTATQGGFRQNAEVEDGDIVMAMQQRLECRHRSANLLSMAVKKGRERHEMWNYVAWSHEEERVQEFLRDYKHLHKRGDECVACQVHQSWRHKIYGRPVRVVPLQVMPGLEMEWHFLATAESDGPSRLYLVQSPVRSLLGTVRVCFQDGRPKVNHIFDVVVKDHQCRTSAICWIERGTDQIHWGQYLNFPDGSFLQLKVEAQQDNRDQVRDEQFVDDQTCLMQVDRWVDCLPAITYLQVQQGRREGTPLLPPLLLDEQQSQRIWHIDWIDVVYNFLKRYTRSAATAQVCGWLFRQRRSQIAESVSFSLDANSYWAEQLVRQAQFVGLVSKAEFLLIHPQYIARRHGEPPEVEVLLGLGLVGVFGNGRRHFVVSYDLLGVTRRVGVACDLQTTILQVFQVLELARLCDATHRCQIVSSALGDTEVFEEWQVVQVPSAISVELRVMVDEGKERIAEQVACQEAEARKIVQQLQRVWADRRHNAGNTALVRPRGREDDAATFMQIDGSSFGTVLRQDPVGLRQQEECNALLQALREELMARPAASMVPVHLVVGTAVRFSQWTDFCPIEIAFLVFARFFAGCKAK